MKVHKINDRKHLKNADFVAWRVNNKRHQYKNSRINAALSSRPRLRRDTMGLIA